MPFESQWARIPLAIRWGVSLLIGVVLIVALVRFVTHNNGNGEAHLSRAGLASEAKQDAIVVGQDQAPKVVHIRSARSARSSLVAGVRADMNHRIYTNNVAGPLQWVRCGRSGADGAKIGYHCIAKADDINYPFLAVITPARHTAVFCKKDYPPVPSETIPVSRRCLL
jgi:hypothetical protein